MFRNDDLVSYLEEMASLRHGRGTECPDCGRSDCNGHPEFYQDAAPWAEVELYEDGILVGICTVQELRDANAEDTELLGHLDTLGAQRVIRWGGGSQPEYKIRLKGE
jgi:hypothetical protein